MSHEVKALQQIDYIKPVDNESEQTYQLVLVIDDEEAVREAVVDILETAKIEAISADSGRLGISIFADRWAEIGAVLLDMRMPGMHGGDVLKALHQINPHIGVLISSGYSEAVIAQDVEDLDSVDFLAKPYNFETLIRKVKAVLDKTKKNTNS